MIIQTTSRFRIMSLAMLGLMIVGTVGLLSGCVLSAATVVPEADAVFDARLLGTWLVEDGSARVEITRASGNAYAIVYTDGDEIGTFHGRVGRLGERLVLDVYPAPIKEVSSSSMQDELRFGAHYLLVVDLGEDEMTVSALDPKSLSTALEAGDLRIPYEETEDGEIILYGNTTQLRSGLARYLERGGKLEEEGVWRRVNR